MKNDSPFLFLRPRVWKHILLVAGLTVFLITAWKQSFFRMTQNFYEVFPGKFYRSAQLTPVEMKEMIERYGIKTVVSLRGAPRNSFWVPGQVALLEKMGVAFKAVWWTTDNTPDKDQLLSYLEILRTAEYPILVHCRTGADRTGEATAIYAMDYMNEAREEAIDDHLSFKYWHIRFLHPAKKALVEAYQGYEWAKNEYDQCAENIRAYAPKGRCSN